MSTTNSAGYDAGTEMHPDILRQQEIERRAKLEEDDTPLGGHVIKDPSNCRCEENNNGRCGCAFGQCINGYIF